MAGPDKQSAIIFPHIPKCGGSSVLKVLQDSEKNLFLDYDNPPSRREWIMMACERRNREFAHLDFSVFDIVYGHFPLNRYCTGKETNRVVLLLRDPVERLVSQYYFWKDVVPDNDYSYLAVEPEIAELKSGRMDLAEFATVFGMDGFYERYTHLPDTSDFLLVGFTHELDVFFDKLSKHIGYNPDQVPAERQNTQPRELSPKIRAKLEALLAGEIAWYNTQLEIWS